MSYKTEITLYINTLLQYKFDIKYEKLKLKKRFKYSLKERGSFWHLFE